MERYDKVRVLRSADVQYGRPQYFQHLVRDECSDGNGPPFAHNPFRSGERVQHLVALRSRDPKPLGVSHPEYGYSGRVFIQEAFDKKGRLRLKPGEEVGVAGPPAQAFPSDETDGHIFLHIGGRGDKVADSVEFVRGVPVAFSKSRPALSSRLSKAAALGLSRTAQEVEERHRLTPNGPRLRKQVSRGDTPGSLPGTQDVEALTGLSFESSAHRRLFSSDAAGHEHAGDKVIENVLDIFEEKPPGHDRIPIALDSLLGKLAIRSGEVGLEGCGYVETPFTSARSSVPSKYSNTADMAELDQMLHQIATSPARKTPVRLARLAVDGGAAAAAAAKHKEMELAEQEKALKQKLSDFSADVARRSRRVEFLEKDIERCEKEESDAQHLLQEVLDVMDPLRTKLAEVNYKVDAQRKILEKYKEEHGEKGIYKTLRKEIKDELNTVQDVKDELTSLEPKEKSKRKQVEDKSQKSEMARKECEKMKSKLAEMQEREAEVKAELKSFRSHKKEVLSQLANASPLLSPVPASPDHKQIKSHDLSSQDVKDTFVRSDKQGGRDLSLVEMSFEGVKESKESAKNSPDNQDEESRFFANPTSWLRRYAMSARAKSPRWRERLNKETELWKLKSVDKKAMKPKFSDSEPLLGQPPSVFVCKIQIPIQIARRWETFCRNPPPPFDNCLGYKVVFENRSLQHVEVRFPTEPKGYLHNFILTFKQTTLSEDELIYQDKFATLSKFVIEETTFTSLQERWAREGLVADTDSDQQSLLAATKPRPEETWHLEQDSELSTLVEKLSEKADPKLIEKISHFKNAPSDLINALVEIADVLWVPGQAKVVDQGTISDSMFYVVSGSLMKRYMQGAGGIALGVVYEGECFCDRRLIETGPNEETVETIGPCKLYRFRTKPFMSILAPFRGFYENLIRLSWKRVAEWEHARKVGGNVKTVGNMPYRWNQMAGPAYHTLKSKSLRAELPTEKAAYEPAVQHILDEMSVRGGGEPSTKAPPLKWSEGLSRWGHVDLLLNTKCEKINPAPFDFRPPDWFKDKARMTEDNALVQAATNADRIRAIEARSSALAWRSYQMKRLGRAMVSSIC